MIFPLDLSDNNTLTDKYIDDNFFKQKDPLSAFDTLLSSPYPDSAVPSIRKFQLKMANALLAKESKKPKSLLSNNPLVTIFRSNEKAYLVFQMDEPIYLPEIKIGVFEIFILALSRVDLISYFLFL